MAICIFDIIVFVRDGTVQERCADAFKHKVLSETLKEINSSSNSCILSKGDQPLPLLISDFFVVYQPDILLENGIKSWHIVLLSLTYSNGTLMVWEK